MSKPILLVFSKSLPALSVFRRVHQATEQCIGCSVCGKEVLGLPSDVLYEAGQPERAAEEVPQWLLLHNRPGYAPSRWTLRGDRYKRS